MAVPHFSEVPDSWQHPVGPYRQAPAEYGGEWWYVNPFTGLTPWVTWVTEAPKKQPKLPAGFEEIFGPRPNSNDFHGAPNPARAFQDAVNLWEQDLKHFKQAGRPEWVSGNQFDEAAAIFAAWGLGPLKLYEGRYGWMARFPGSKIKNFETSVWEAINYPHLVVPRYQMQLAGNGVELGERHPFLPAHFK